MSTHSAARESATSAAGAGAAGPRCATLQSALKMLQALTVPEADESEVAALVCHVAVLYRSAILAQLAAAIAALPVSATSAPSAAGAVGLSLSAFTTLWDAKIERKIVMALGPHVCAEGSSKKGGCGPFFGPLMQDLKSRCSSASSSSSATGGVTVSAVFDALSSQPMLEFHTRYFEGFIPNAIASSSSSLKFGKMSELLAAAVQVFLQDWSAMLSSRPVNSSTFSSSPSALIADVVSMLRPISSRLFLTLDSRINPLPKGASLKLSERMARELEVATRHKNMMTKFEAWAASTFGKSGGGAAGVESTGAAGERTCKYSSCFDHEGSTIHSASPAVKWVFVRCSEGCASSFHHACWHVVEADIEPDDESTTPEEAAVGARCVHSRERKCKGRLVRVDLKQNGKVLSHLQELTKEEASAPDADDDEDFDPTAESGSGADSSSGGLEVVGKRWRGQCKSSWYKVKHTENEGDDQHLCVSFGP